MTTVKVLRRLGLTLFAALLLLSASGLPVDAQAAPVPSPAWQISLVPTSGQYLIALTNTGSVASSGTIALEDTLPAGAGFHGSVDGAGWECSVGGSALVVLTCAYAQSVPPLGQSTVLVVPTSGAAPGLATDTATVTGGGAPPASATSSTEIGGPPPPFGFLDFASQASDLSGAPATQAGSHPYALTTALDFSNTLVGFPLDQTPKAMAVELPTGLIGDPQAAPRCTIIGVFHQTCPAATRVGSFFFNLDQGLFGNAPASPVYNVIPERGHPAEFGFYSAIGIPVFAYASVGPAPGYNLRVSFPDLPASAATSGAIVSFFGDPAAMNNPPGVQQNPSVPFFTNPSVCSGIPLTTGVKVNTWEEPGTAPGVEDTANAQPVTNCEALQFHPTFTFTPDTTAADSPTGPSVDLSVPQAPEELEALATPPLRDASVALPPGLAVNPSTAGGLQGCTPAQIALETTEPATCPGASQIGTAQIATPLLEETVAGQVFIGAPDCSPCTSRDAEEGKLLKLYIQAHQPQTGVVVKLPGTVSADPATGQLTASFKNNPQLPFSDLKLDFKTGPRAPLRTPTTCGHYTTTTDLTPWSAPQTPDATPSSSFDVTAGPGGQPCVTDPSQRPLAPSFSGGTLNPVAGAFSPFAMKLSREDGQQEFSSLNVTTPPGVAADLRGVPYCSEAQLAAVANNSGTAEQANPSCPAASQIGTVNVGAGAGPNPFYISGRAYLAGPYKGGPLSLAIITPALAGPFDLGTVVVRSALQINPETAQITVKSDPLPQILDGIPLDLRDIRVSIDRPHFTNNPTDCEPLSLFADVFGSPGAATRLQNRFQVGECGALGFKPHLALSLKGPTHRTGNPALKAVVTYPKQGAYANIAAAQVTLPHSEFLDQAHIGTVCTRVQFAAKACPAASIYGHATATTPLLDKPLSGPVYLRSSDHKLPDLVADLNGQIEVTLDGRVDTGKGGGIRNTFTAVPDAPVSKFVLSMQGGNKGLLVNSENLCSPQAKNHAIADFTGQNGKVSDTEPIVQNSCKKKSKKHAKGKHHR